MTGVLDDQPDVMLASKRDPGRCISGTADIDGIVRVVTQKAGTRFGGKGITTLILKIRIAERGGGICVQLRIDPLRRQVRALGSIIMWFMTRRPQRNRRAESAAHSGIQLVPVRSRWPFGVAREVATCRRPLNLSGNGLTEGQQSQPSRSG